MILSIILPTQLFPKYIKCDVLVLIEDSYYINNKMHKQKLMVHRASCQAWFQQCDHTHKLYINHDVHFDSYDIMNNITKIIMYDPVDKYIINKYRLLAERYNVDIVFYHSPAIGVHTSKLELFHKDYKDAVDLCGEFMKYFKFQNNVGMKRFGMAYTEPQIPVYNNKFIAEAYQWVQKYFCNSYGYIDWYSHYPVTRDDALSHLRYFQKNKLSSYQNYYAACTEDMRNGMHPSISSALNIGILLPDDIRAVGDEFLTARAIGMRTYMIYLYKYNNVHAKRPSENSLPPGFLLDTAPSEIVSALLKKIYNTGYLTNSERVIMLSYVFLNNIDLQQYAKWAIQSYIDSYDWITYATIFANLRKRYPDVLSCGKIIKISDYSYENTWDVLYKKFVTRIKASTVLTLPPKKSSYGSL